MMQTRKMEDYLDAIHAERYPVPMLLRAPAGQALQGHIKAAFDHGVLSRRALERVAGDDLYPTLLPLFRAWQDNGLVTLEADYLVLTLAGQFWSVTLAQNLIRSVITLRSEHQAA